MQVHLSAKWQMAGMQAKQTRGYGDCDMLLAHFAQKGAWQYAGAQAKNTMQVASIQMAHHACQAVQSCRQHGAK
jgi:hypothetical protein